MANNPMMATMLKGLGIDPGAIAKMGGDIGAAFTQLTQAARAHTEMLQTIMAEQISQRGKIDAIMDRLEIVRPMTEDEFTLAAAESAAHIALLENAHV